MDLGIALAGLLNQAGYPVTVVLLGEVAKLPADAAQAYQAWTAAGGVCQAQLPTEGRWRLIVDGLFGIGLARPLEGLWRDAVEWINAQASPVLALDIPSGLHAETGAVLGAAVDAKWTITFIGNKKFSDSTLRGVIQTRESAWYRFLTSDDTYDPDRLSFDEELLRRFYNARGYADFQVISAVAELTPDGKSFYITFTVEEGPKYTFGEVKVDTTLEDLGVEQLEVGRRPQAVAEGRDVHRPPRQLDRLPRLLQGLLAVPEHAQADL